MSTANPLWGAPRIHGELHKLGLSVSQSTVAKYMQRHPRPPSQTWRTFPTNHASQGFSVATAEFEQIEFLAGTIRPSRYSCFDGFGHNRRTAYRQRLSLRPSRPHMRVTGSSLDMLDVGRTIEEAGHRAVREAAQKPPTAQPMEVPFQPFDDRRDSAGRHVHCRALNSPPVQPIRSRFAVLGCSTGQTLRNAKESRRFSVLGKCAWKRAPSPAIRTLSSRSSNRFGRGRRAQRGRIYTCVRFPQLQRFYLRTMVLTATFARPTST
jgi:hypothetical protein